MTVLLSCSSSRDLEVAKQGVEQFRKKLAAEQDDAIYAESDEIWKKSTDQETSRKFFVRLRRKMGSCQHSQPVGWRVNYTTGGSFVILQYQTKCAAGDLGETFTWRVQGNNVRLTAYNANSPLLLTD